MERRSWRILVAITFLLAIMIIWLSGLPQCMALQHVQQHAATLKNLVKTYYVLSVILYVLIYIFNSVFALPLASVMTLVSGFLFGTIPGVIYTVIGAMIGATCSFLLMRFLLHDYIQRRYAQRLKGFNRALERHGYRYLIGMRLIPVIPFFVANILAACSNVSLSIFVITTFIGVIPVATIYAITGEELGAVDSLYALCTPRFLTIAALLFLLMIVPLMISLYKKKYQK